MKRHIDRHLPAIPDEEMVCYGCGQTFDVIVDGGTHLPDRHYISPVIRMRNCGTKTLASGEIRRYYRPNPARVATTATCHDAVALCPNTGDDLAVVLLQAQIDEARAIEGRAA